MKHLLLSVAMLVAGTSAWGQELKLGEPAYGGTGCPAGTASVVLSPDQTALSILFDQYVAESGAAKRMDRKTCNIAIPVHVPQGYSVAVLAVDYRGFMSIPSGGQGRFDVEYFWAGARGPRILRDFNGPMNDSFNIRDQLQATTLVWTRCGESVNLRVNSSLQAITNRRGEQTYASVDSADVSSRVVYHLQWKRCF